MSAINRDPGAVRDHGGVLVKNGRNAKFPSHNGAVGSLATGEEDNAGTLGILHGEFRGGVGKDANDALGDI